MGIDLRIHTEILPLKENFVCKVCCNMKYYTEHGEEGVKELSPKGGRKGYRKSVHAACPLGPELKPGTYRVLGESQ